MRVEVNLRHLEEHSLRLQGSVPVAELDLDLRDELVQPAPKLEYDFEAQKLDKSLLLQGRLRLGLKCQCVRCLKEFEQTLILDPWACHAALDGPESVPVVNDSVDLTPLIREDILLEFPQHPLCEPECKGMSGKGFGKAKQPGKAGHPAQKSSAWAELDKLKLKH